MKFWESQTWKKKIFCIFGRIETYMICKDNFEPGLSFESRKKVFKSPISLEIGLRGREIKSHYCSLKEIILSGCTQGVNRMS